MNVNINRTRYRSYCLEHLHPESEEQVQEEQVHEEHGQLLVGDIFDDFR